MKRLGDDVGVRRIGGEETVCGWRIWPRFYRPICSMLPRLPDAWRRLIAASEKRRGRRGRGFICSINNQLSTLTQWCHPVPKTSQETHSCVMSSAQMHPGPIFAWHKSHIVKHPPRFAVPREPPAGRDRRPWCLLHNRGSVARKSSGPERNMLHWRVFYER